MKTLTSPNTHIAKQRQQQLTQLQSVCQLLGWTHEQYCQHQYNEYEAFIARVCKDLPKAAQKLRYSSIFRGFYNQEWALRNQNEFLNWANDLTKPMLELFTSWQPPRQRVLEGVRFHEPLTFGDSYFINEYQAIHSARNLYYNEAFAEKYAHIIDLIETA